MKWIAQSIKRETHSEATLDARGYQSLVNGLANVLGSHLPARQSQNAPIAHQRKAMIVREDGRIQTQQQRKETKKKKILTALERRVSTTC